MKADPLGMARALVAGWVRAGDTVVDATVGNGHDTLFLARLAGPGGRVIGYDVQPTALATTRARLAAAGLAAELHLGSHAAMLDDVPAGVAAVMFNLGYLPGGDKRVTTRSAETLAALAAALELVRVGGGITLVCYPGHPGGAEEAAAVGAWAAGLPSRQFCAVRCHGLNASESSGFLISVSVVRPPDGPSSEGMG